MFMGEYVEETTPFHTAAISSLKSELLKLLIEVKGVMVSREGKGCG